jgi:hypothetical protein
MKDVLFAIVVGLGSTVILVTAVGSMIYAFIWLLKALF